ncbi:uncharacterized protein FOBCDRAFT_281565 [Fusarium oxysporum Fo47]|uniref:Uncharacterized protein n=1 Tax=Fusarium oxysporum Fo47 TaxID=660027 RepID=W9JFF5_FUSOX|nr:uncharacterized protein FOBCDRAFT_281565 [Fusarium oxysporum Fo47]EWZ30651.1 hypothetical protein FOZG_16124 [Fusarium oxysporum Fo47]EWZ85144.1 hypothetical protein FOWG_11657 [Fusarium oxysporum f. sp. lycopersici MN25]QKD61932.1 hypothetical protein FOBCDRAFT_281565 [Fusarium oxysporum Fo47]
MASLIASAAYTLLVKFGTGLAGKAGGWVFQEGLAAVTGGTDTEKVRQDIANLRKDGLRTYITDIETYYSTIVDIMQEAFQLHDRNLTDADRVRQAQGLQKRLDNRLQVVRTMFLDILTRSTTSSTSKARMPFSNRLQNKLSINPMIFLDIKYSGCKLTTSTKPLFIIILGNL